MQVKISDFGFAVKVRENSYLSGELASKVSSLIQPSLLTELLGTPGYLAPEMLQRSVDFNAPGYNKEIDL